MNWDLSSYFPAFGGPEMRAFREVLDADLEALLARTGQLPPLDAGSADAWEQALVDYEELVRRMGHMGSYLGCLTAADGANEAYRQQESAFARVYAGAEKIEVELMRGLRDADAAQVEALTGRASLAGAAHYVTRLRQAARKTMSPAEERLAADLGVDGLHGWGRLYDNLSGRLTFEMAWPDGRTETLPMSQRRSLMARGDRAVRRAAFDGGNAAWEAVQDVTGAALNAIAGTRLTLNRHRGVDHFLDNALFQAKIERASLDAMLAAIRERAELARRVLRLQARAQGTSAVAWYDIEAPLPLPGQEPTLTWDDAKARVGAAFDAAYPALGTYFRDLIDAEWVEWEPRADKRPGAFCTGSMLSKESRIYMTFNGALNDVRTLAHEAGHAFHHHLLKDARPYAHDYPMTLAESASTFAEMILTEGLLADGSLSDADKLRIVDLEARQAVAFLLDIPVRFEFERAFHEERQAGEVDVSRLRQLMAQTQARLFGDVMEPGGGDPLFWASKLHFYITGVTFYNFPYTFGFLLSRGLFARFREEGADFLPRYEAFLQASGADTAENVVRQTLGADLTTPDFWRDAIDTLNGPIEQLESLWASLGRT